jgi:hypothetical protein
MINFTRFSHAMGRMNTERLSLKDLEAFPEPAKSAVSKRANPKVQNKSADFGSWGKHLREH